MSIANEVERIKTNISNAYIELENKGATIPSDKNSNNLASAIASVSSGASINGKLEQKVCSGSVSKGDLVCVNQPKDALITNANDISTVDLTVSNKTNIIDGNLETYCTCTKNSDGGGYIYFRMPTYDNFGITADTTITKFGVKYIFTNSVELRIGFNATLFQNFSTTTQLINLQGFPFANYSASSSKREVGFEYSTMFKASFLQYYGGRIASLNSKGTSFNLYGIKTYIEYIDNGVVKTVTSNTDIIGGVANSDGTDGSTIDVYVPNVE